MPSNPPDVIAPAYIFFRNDGNGLFKVQRSFAYWQDPINGLIETQSIEATASFKLSTSDLFFVDPGSISCQQRNLSLQSNSAYLLNGNAVSTLNFGDTSGVNWYLAGNASIGITPLGFTTAKPMPVYVGVANNSIPGTIARSKGFQLPLGANLKYADSVFISITVGQKSIVKTSNALLSYCAFSNSELGTLPPSNGATALLQVSPINFDATIASGKKLYFANQSSYSKFIEVK